MVRYSYQIYKGQVNPALSTWVIFFLGGFLSFLTYLSASGETDFEGGIFNMVDMVGDLAVIFSVLLWAENPRVRMEPFEKKYLSAAGTLALFWLVSGNAFVSNLLIQLLIMVGYVPTIVKIIKRKKNTESFSSWGPYLAAGLIAGYIAFGSGDILAAAYAIKSIVMVSIVLAVMIFYEIKERVKNS